jgi:hypothetical protein
MDDKDIIIRKIKELAPQGKISCTDAHLIAKTFEVEPEVVGELCNQLKIKVCACELGCF